MALQGYLWVKNTLEEPDFPLFFIAEYINLPHSPL